MSVRRFGWLSLVALGLFACGGGTDVDPNGGLDGGQVGPEVPADGGGVPDGGDACALPFAGEGRTLITHRAGPRRLSSDGAWLYVSVTGALSQSEGVILRVPLAGGAVEEVASGLRAPDALLAEADAVYVVDLHGLWRVDLPSLQRTLVHDALNAAVLGASSLLPLPEALLYVSGFRRIVRVGRDGSGPVVLHEAPAGAAVRGAAVVGADLYFLVIEGSESDRGLWRVPVNGSAAATRVLEQPEDGRALLAGDDALLWTEASGQVRRWPLAGGEPETLMSGLGGPERLASVAGALYVKNATSQASGAFFMARDPCGQTLEVGPIGTGPGDVLEHGGVLYFTSEDRTGQGYVARLP